MWLLGFPLPAWIGWPTAVAVGFGFSWALTAFATAVALRGYEAKGGDGRLRAAMSARTIGTLHLVGLPAVAILDLLFRVRSQGGAPPRPGGVAVAFAAALAVRGVAVLAERRICPPASTPPEGRADSARRTLVAMTLGWPAYWVLALVAAALPGRWSPWAFIVMGLGILATAGQIRGAWLGPLRRVGEVRPASARLGRVVAGVADRVGVRPLGVVELDSSHANALALVVPKILIYTVPILETLDDGELAAITAHELGHLSEPRRVVVLRALQPFFPLVALASLPSEGSGSTAVLIVLGLFFAYLGIIFFHARAARKMEIRCDAIAREHEGEPGTYGRALAKIYEANRMPVVGATAGGIYPELRDRMAEGGVAPKGPKPARIKASLVPLLPLAAIAAASYLASHRDEAARWLDRF